MMQPMLIKEAQKLPNLYGFQVITKFYISRAVEFHLIGKNRGFM